MKKYKFLPPYQTKNPGRTTYPETVNRSGVYLIKEDNRLVYVGFSGKNLYRTLYRHFEAWNHKGQQVISYKTRLNRHKYTVRVILCTPQQAARLERALVIKHQPRDNENKYKTYLFDKWDEKIYQTYTETEVTDEPPF